MKPIHKIVFIAIVVATFPVLSQDSFVWDDVKDFTKLRNEFGWREDYRDLCEKDRPLKEMVDAVNSQDAEKILSVTIPWLKQCPVDIQAHMFALVGYSIPKPTEAGRIHFKWYEGLINSILNSGDGKTAETAYVSRVASNRASTG